MWSSRNKHLLPLVATALSAAYAILVVSGQSSAAGFMNIDCGQRAGHSCIDYSTDLNYTSDFEYIDTGKTHSVDPSNAGKGEYCAAYRLRSFPTGIRNCYTVKPVKKGGKYLVQAFFLYGNYDEKNSTPEFDLHLGVNFWTTVSFADGSGYYSKEIITVTTSDQISVCLINKDMGTPFMSALELRLLPRELYETHLTSEETFSLVRYARDNIGGNYKRYPNDRYDRKWYRESMSHDYDIVKTKSLVQSKSKEYETPTAVMKTAIYPTSSSRFSYDWTTSGFDLHQNSSFLLILHFAEIQELKVNETRIFSITVDDDYTIAKAFSPSYLVTTSLHQLVPSTVKKFSLVATKQSTLPPIINALEVFAVRNRKGTETSNDDVDAATTIKREYKLQKNWVGDPCSPPSFRWEGLNCSDEGFNNFRIVSIDLSSSGLTGEISTSFASLSELQYLDLSRNELTGDVPDNLANLIHLKFLNLSWNKLRGNIPMSLLDRSAAGTLTLDYDKFVKPEENGHGENGKKRTIIILIVVIVVVFVAAAVLVLFLLCRKRRRPGEPTPMSPSLPRQSKQLTLHGLQKITDNFQRQIGRGGFGPVYYGELDNDRVAVKMLSGSSSQGSKEFQAEARLLTTIHHRNLVSLIGYCNEEKAPSLIYEYMGGGNLRDHLTGKSGHILSWIQRLNISIDAAQGLDYLHIGCKPAIVHRDVKTNNILLDENLNAKLADFGLSRFITADSPTISSKLMGTPGYYDPEWSVGNNLNKKSDVYSFGVVLLELITGFPAILTQFQGITLVEWVRPKFERGQITEIVDRRIFQIIDGRIYKDCENNSVWKVVEIAMACVCRASEDRPNMTKVLVDLRDSLEIATKGEKPLDTTSTSSTATQLSSAYNNNMPKIR